MLLIAQPKTASTSLLDALKEATGLPGEQEFGLTRKYGRAKDAFPLKNSDMIELTWKILTRWIHPTCWRKQHVIPSQNNLDFCELCVRHGVRFAITLRDPLDTVDALRRLPHAKRETEEQELAKLRMLKWFNARWRAVAEKFEDAYMVVDFDQLIDNPSRVVNLVLEHYGFNCRVSDDYKLPKRRYTGKGKQKFQF